MMTWHLNTSSLPYESGKKNIKKLIGSTCHPLMLRWLSADSLGGVARGWERRRWHGRCHTAEAAHGGVVAGDDTAEAADVGVAAHRSTRCHTGSKIC